MTKNTIFTAALFLMGGLATAQVGINNTAPNATLDITAKNTNGSSPEGLIAPRLTGDQIKAADAQYGTAQKGTIVYATAAVTSASTKTAAITAEGYYYFDGSLWQKVANGSTYSGSSSVVINGSAFERAALTGDVTATQNSNATTIAANAVTTAKIADNAVTVTKLPTGATSTTFLRGDGTWVTPTDTNTTYTAGSGLTLTGTSFSANDATTAVKGIVQLAGDLSGTASLPAIAADAVNSAKIADGTVANADLVTGAGGLYKGSGSLSGATTVAQGANALAFTSTATTGTSHFTVDGNTLNVDAVNNRIGIGTAAPRTALEVNGAASNTAAYNAGSGTTIDFSLSNLAYTTANPGTFTLNNLKDGAVYTLAVRGTTSGTAAFSASGFTFKSVSNAATTAGKETLYTFLVMGTTVYTSMTTGL